MNIRLLLILALGFLIDAAISFYPVNYDHWLPEFGVLVGIAWGRTDFDIFEDLGFSLVACTAAMFTQATPWMVIICLISCFVLTRALAHKHWATALVPGIVAQILPLAIYGVRNSLDIDLSWLIFASILSYSAIRAAASVLVVRLLGFT